ncbi:MAG TPA: HAD-IIIC family phosphatase [Anaeromyxobacteraceae bacterium]|nr:HAD-IIIC family phosphatase [Anaeromyxobacteraceae bacterium]
MTTITERLRASRNGRSLSSWLGRVAEVAAEMAAAPFALRGCTRVGRRVRTVGVPRIENQGALEVGDDVFLNSRWCPIELDCGPGATLSLGDGAHLNFGTWVSARRLVRIGAGVQIGQYGVISDTEAPGDGPETAQPVEIADGAWLAGRVTVRPGSRIGRGSVVTAGSVVSGDIPAGVVAGGNPARVLRRLDGAAVSGASAPTPSGRAVPAAAPAPGVRGVLASDFTVDDLARHLADPSDPPVVHAEVAPFGQVAQTILAGPRADASDFLLVWTRPESAAPAFARALGGEAVEEGAVLEDVDRFCDLVAGGAGRWRAVFVATWTLPPHQRGFGFIDARAGGCARLLAAMNLRLMDRLAASGNVYVLDASRWAVAGGPQAQNPRAWFLGKIAFGGGAFAEAARDVKAALRGLGGGARKLVVVDLDDTLWGGIVGDLGWENLRLGGHDAVGEALVAFQQGLATLKRRGVLLAIVSKNEESVALEAIRSHPAMVLRQDDFVAWRINWRDKASNLAEIVAELNLGLQSVVFLDDNPVERARVAETLPEVLVPDWPEDKLLYPSALGRLRCFDVPALSREDAERTRLYAEERKREALRQEVGSIDDWLVGLGTRVTVEPLGPSNLTRAAQLLNKTNQMNLATRRLTEQELVAWSGGDGRRLWTVSVSDRFGDAGLTGIVSVEADGAVCRVVDYLLSCRVMGRRIEEAMVHLAVETARTLNGRFVEAQLVPTAKNKPCLGFWQSSGFESTAPNVFRWDVSVDYPVHRSIQLDWKGARR